MRLKTYFLKTMLLLVPAIAAAQSEIKVYDDNVGREEVINLPEGMLDMEIDSMMRDWSTKAYITYNGNDCRSTGENKTYSPEEYMRRLQNLPNVIEMPYNQVVQKFIDQYCGRLRRSVALMLGASNFYTPIFEDALESYQIPLELKYLPIIESALNPGATSHAGACGLWQFMPTTGKKYGLEITSLIDERRDPVKASYAAAHYLKNLYEIFGDWTLVIASYNCGPGNVNKAIKRAGGVKDYWQIYSYLPTETRGYVPAFIAANYIMNYYCEHNICPAETRLPLGTDTVMIDRDINLEQISSTCGISLEELKALNPQYRTNRVPGAAHLCSLRMPVDVINTFIENSDSVYNYHADELLNSRIVADVNENVIEERSYGRSRHGRHTSRSRRGRSITVRSGDNLSSIAKRNGTTVAALKRKNGITGSMLRPGQKLRVR